MKNKLIFTTLSYISGVILAYTEILATNTLIIIFPLIFLIVLLTLKNRRKSIYYLVIVCLSIIIGFFIAKNNLKIILDDYYDQVITIEGKVIEKELNNQSFIINIDNLKTNEIVLNEIDEKMILNLDETSSLIKVGSNIKVKGRILENLHSNNRYIFNYKEYLSKNNIHGTMFVEKSDIERLEEENILYKFRNNILVRSEEFIDNNSNKENAGILKSVLYGDTDYLDSKFLVGVRKTGIAHIFAVSGLHIGIFIVVFSYIFKFLKFNLRKSQIILIGFLWYYAFIIGFPVSILRALILFSILTLGNLLYRKNSPFNSISLVGLILLIYNPLWLFDVGFQLSFSTTITIYLYINYMSPKIKNKYISKLLFIPFVQIGIMPILAYYFNYVSLFSFIGNLILVPIFSLILSGAIVGVILSFIILPLAESIFYFVNFGLEGFRLTLEYLFYIPYLGIQVASPGISFLFLYYTTFAYLIFISNFKFYNRIKNFIAISIVLFTLYWIFLPLFDNSLEVSFLDVGQGNASYMKYKGNNIFVDLGGNINSSYNKGEKELPEYIKKRGIFNIDMVFISHLHEDHYCSLDEVNEISKIKNIFVYRKSKEILGSDKTNIIEVKKGDSIVIDEDFSIDVLWPKEGFCSTDENENSLVLMINYFDKKILFTGDINNNIEDRIIDDIDKIDLLLVPHHGSSTSSGEEFINKIKADVSVLSYGDNFYGIPSLDVINRYYKSESDVYSTFKDGEIWAIIDRKGYSIKTKENESFDKINFFEILTGIFFVYFISTLIVEGDFYNEKIERLQEHNSYTWR